MKGTRVDVAMCGVHACAGVCAHGLQRLTPGVFHDHSAPCFETGSHGAEMEFTNYLDWLALKPGRLLPQLPRVHHHAWLFMSVVDENSGSHACIQFTLGEVCPVSDFENACN